MVLTGNLLGKLGEE